MITTMNSSEPSKWCVILPIKGGAQAKSRLGMGPDVTSLAYEFAKKTLAAILACQEVHRVIIVTSDEYWEVFASNKVTTLADPGEGLNAAICAARDHEFDELPLAVIPGDLPLLDPIDLAGVLVSAKAFPFAFVRDKDGVGTTILTSLKGPDLIPRYGQDSAAAHLSIGATELTAPHSVRFDVDTPIDLAQITG